MREHRMVTGTAHAEQRGKCSEAATPNSALAWQQEVRGCCQSPLRAAHILPTQSFVRLDSFLIISEMLLLS